MHMEYAMRVPVSSTALGLALVAGATVAHAQTIITQPSITVPATAVVQSVQTVQTTQTVRTVRPATSRRPRQIVTTRTITRQIAPGPAIVARTIPATPQPLYDEVAPAPIAASADYDYSRPLYDSVVPPVAPAPFASTTAVGEYTMVPTYRYVYEPDRILVIDPATGTTVQAIPR
jgi:hypothetical protein